MANNLFANRPCACVALQTASFSAAGFDGSNTHIIYEVGEPLLSYVPGRAINGVTTFTINRGYWIVPKIDMDKTAYVVPPLAGTSQLATPGSFSASVISDTQINLSWSAVTSATGYVLERATNAGFTTGLTTLINGWTATSFNDTGRTEATQYFYRIKAVASGFLDSNYATTNATTTGGVFEEFITWSQLQNATAPGAGDLVASGTSPQGGTATKRLAKVDGNYVEAIIPATVSDANSCALCLCPANDADYDWGDSSNLIFASTYVYLGNHITGTAHTNNPPTTLSALNAGNIIRMEISGNDILVRKSTNNGFSFSTEHTHTGVLAGVSNIYVKGILAIPTSGLLINAARGLGLTV